MYVYIFFFFLLHLLWPANNTPRWCRRPIHHNLERGEHYCWLHRLTTPELVILLVVSVNCWNTHWSSSKLGQRANESPHCITDAHPQLPPPSNLLNKYPNYLSPFCPLPPYIYRPSECGMLPGHLASSYAIIGRPPKTRTWRLCARWIQTPVSPLVVSPIVLFGARFTNTRIRQINATSPWQVLLVRGEAYYTVGV